MINRRAVVLAATVEDLVDGGPGFLSGELARVRGGRFYEWFPESLADHNGDLVIRPAALDPDQPGRWVALG